MNKIKQYYKKLSPNERATLFDNFKVPITYNEMKEIFHNNGFKFIKYNGWSNDTILIDGFKNEYFDSSNISICNLSLLGIKNWTTKYNLSYSSGEGTYRYPFTYVIDKLIHQFYEFDCDENFCHLKKTNYNATPEQKEECRQIIKDTVSEILKEMTDKMTLKNKKAGIKHKVQKIENDIDFVIEQFAEEAKKYQIQYSTDDIWKPQNVVTVHKFYKSLQGYGSCRGPVLSIRKLVDGRYTSNYKRVESWDQVTTCWKKMKKDLTPDEMKEYLEKYFSPWYNVPCEVKPMDISTYFEDN